MLNKNILVALPSILPKTLCKLVSFHSYHRTYKKTYRQRTREYNFIYFSSLHWMAHHPFTTSFKYSDVRKGNTFKIKENRIYIRGEFRKSLGMNFVSPFQPEREFKVYKSCSQIICSRVH